MPGVAILAALDRALARLAATLDADLEVQLGGGLLVAAEPSRCAHRARKAAWSAPHGLPIELLDRAELRRFAPYVSDRMVGGSLLPDRGQGQSARSRHPPSPPQRRRAARASALASKSSPSSATPEDSGSDGARDSPRTPRRERRRHQRGAPRRHGRRIDRHPGVPIQVSVTEPAAPLLKHLVYCARDRLTMKQTKQGSILIGGGWPALLDERGRAQVSAQSMARNLKVAVEIVPNTASLNIVRTWAAIVNGTARLDAHDRRTAARARLLSELLAVDGLHRRARGRTHRGQPRAGQAAAADLDLAPFSARRPVSVPQDLADELPRSLWRGASKICGGLPPSTTCLVHHRDAATPRARTPFRGRR